MQEFDVRKERSLDCTPLDPDCHPERGPTAETDLIPRRRRRPNRGIPSDGESIRDPSTPPALLRREGVAQDDSKLCGPRLRDDTGGSGPRGDEGGPGRWDETSSSSHRAIHIDDFGQCPLPIADHDTVQLSHGSGGRMMNRLIRDLFVWAFDNPELRHLDDCATLVMEKGRLSMSTDSFVVDPIFFPGGNIGDLAVNGTVNDVSMSGAKPLYMSVGMILEEGLPLADLREIVISMRRAADRAGVTIVTGDTKVVNKGKGDKIFINTTGLGVIDHYFVIGSSELRPGDVIIVSGSIADHGMAILSKREGLRFETPIASDTAPLNGLVEVMLQAGGEAIHALRDPTRGGVAATLNEFATASGVQIDIQEEALPIKPPVSGACEFLGLDPLYVANEGKLIAAVASDSATDVLETMRRHEYGEDATIIGSVTEGRPGMVTMKTRIGGRRIVDMLVGEQLPRIC